MQTIRKVIWMLFVGSCCTEDELWNPLKNTLPPPPSQRGWRPAEAILDTLMQHSNPLLSSFNSSLQPLTGGRARWWNEQRATQHSQSNGGGGAGENNMGREEGGLQIGLGLLIREGRGKKGGGVRKSRSTAMTDTRGTFTCPHLYSVQERHAISPQGVLLHVFCCRR